MIRQIYFCPLSDPPTTVIWTCQYGLTERGFQVDPALMLTVPAAAGSVKYTSMGPFGSAL
jgi:hypothetical protein